MKTEKVSETFGFNFEIAFSRNGNVQDLYVNIKLCGNSPA
jgi:hypothetical protein